jgi:hypothetical protein
MRMSRGRGLYQAIAEPDNLRLAFRKALRGKSGRQEVLDYRRNLDQNLADLRTDLLTGDIKVSDYHFFTIYDPKERTICAAPFRERVLHHAVVNLCEPVFERYSIDDSYACRPEKGLHRALKRAQQFTREYPWYLKMDIRKYFDSIHHETLLRLLARRFRDNRLMRLFEQVVRGYQTLPDRGLPIGNLLSQHFANFYLGLLDHYLKEECRVSAYLRYMDDFLIFGASREILKSELWKTETFLCERLCLSLKDATQLNRAEFGVPFLGFRIYPHVIRLSPRSRRRFAQKVMYYENEEASGGLSEAQLARRVSALVSFTKAADAAGFRRLFIQRRRVSSEGAPTA